MLSPHFETMESQWNDFRAKCLRNAPEEKVAQIRLLFYSGALACYSAVVINGPDDDALALEQLGVVQKEFDDFVDNVPSDNSGVFQ